MWSKNEGVRTGGGGAEPRDPDTATENRQIFIYSEFSESFINKVGSCGITITHDS